MFSPWFWSLERQVRYFTAIITTYYYNHLLHLVFHKTIYSSSQGICTYCHLLDLLIGSIKLYVILNKEKFLHVCSILNNGSGPISEKNIKMKSIDRNRCKYFIWKYMALVFNFTYQDETDLNKIIGSRNLI